MKEEEMQQPQKKCEKVETTVHRHRTTYKKEQDTEHAQSLVAVFMLARLVG